MMHSTRQVLGILSALLLVPSAATAQTSSAFTGAQDFPTDGEIDFESPAVTGESVAGAHELPRSATCDLRDAIPFAPFPYCGGDGGLSLVPGSESDPNLLAFLTQTDGPEDIAWLSVDELLQEVGRCNPEGAGVINALAYNPYSICGRSNTLYASRSKIIELDMVVGSVTSDRICSADDPGESTVEGAEICGVLREFSFDGQGLIGALTFADPPSLGRPVLVASSGLDLKFLAPDSPGCGPEVEVVHECRIYRNAKGLAWMGGDRFLVADPFNRRLDILEIAGRGCRIAGTFHLPGGGRVGGITYDPKRELLLAAEAVEGAIFALPLDPVDLDLVAITEPDTTAQCGVGDIVLDAAGTCDPDEDPTNFRYIWTTPDGDELLGSFRRAPVPPVGTYTYQLQVQDGRGNSDTDHQQVTVLDTRAPRIVNLSVSPGELWPPNGKLVSVEVDANVDEACDPEPRCMIVDVESSEPFREGVPDWEFRSDLEVALRAERDGDDDRIYTLNVECRDESGNASSDTVQVRVPHNDPGYTCPCWSRAELKSIAPNPDTDSWLQTCKSGDDNLPDEDSIKRILGRSGHLAVARSGSEPGEYSCQYVASAPNVPFARDSRIVDEGAYEICRNQIRLRHKILGIADECTTN
jgi:hypothetical protein